jgi:uncharacterized protein (DUF2267 family)
MHPFEKLNQTATPWVESMMAELSTADSHQALRALGAGLEALRDLLTPAQAAHFGARLPVLIRGLFFERWDPTITPREIRHRSQFLALVGEKYAPRADVPTDAIAAAFLGVLARHLGAEDIVRVASKVPTPLEQLRQAVIAGSANGASLRLAS